MARRTALLFGGVALCGVGVALLCGERPAGTVDRRPPIHVDGERELGPVALPDGEWWGEARDFAVLVHMDHAEGVAGVATKDGDLLFDVALTYPEIQIAADVSIPNVDEPTYVLTNAEHLSTWRLVPPAPPSDSEIGTDRDVFDRLDVEGTQGSFGAGQPSFPLFRTAVRPPEPHCSAGELAVIGRLRQLVASQRKARGRGE